MQHKEIYLIRHGETDFNKLGIVQGCGVDTSLNANGVYQSQAFYRYYKSIPFDAVIHSNLARSKETVRPFIQDGLKPFEMPEIREISWGVYEGQPYTNEMRTAYKNMIESWDQDQLDARLDGGESAAELMSRVYRAIELLYALPHKKLLVCSHGRTIRAMMCAFQDLHPRQMETFQHENTGLFRMEYKYGDLKVHTLNDLRHLAQNQIK